MKADGGCAVFEFIKYQLDADSLKGSSGDVWTGNCINCFYRIEFRRLADTLKGSNDDV